MSNVTALKPRTQERYLSPAQVCELLPGLTLDVLAARRSKRLAPDYFKPAGGADSRSAVLYAESDVRAWIESSRVKTREQS